MGGFISSIVGGFNDLERDIGNAIAPGSGNDFALVADLFAAVMLPQFVGNSVAVGLFESGAVSTSTALMAANIAQGATSLLTLAAVGDSMAQQGQVSAAQAQGMLINTSSNIAPIPVIYGYRRVGGTRTLTQVSGASNEFLHIIIVLCEGEIDSVPNIYIDNVLSTDAKFAGLVTTYVHTGTDTQAADANLIADLPAIWGSAYPGSGVAYIYVKLKYASTAFSGFPTITADVLGIKTYDPRTGAAPLGDVCLIAAIGNITDTTGATISTGVVQPTTAVSGQTWSQTYPAGYPVQTGVVNPGSLAANQTWLQVRANPALCIRDYLTNTRYGRGISASLIDDASIIAAANYCDAMVTIPTGTQARYTCNGVVNVDSTAFDNIKLLLASCRAMLVYSAGKYKLICDAAQSSAFSFNEDNITGAWSIATAGRATKLNRVTAQFYDPASNWQPNYAISESTAYRSAQDNGLVLEAQVSLAFTCNLYTAQQLAGLQLKQSRFGLVVSFKAFQVGLRCEVGDVVDITHSTPGWSGKLFRITQITILDTEEVEIVASEYDATVYALNTLTAITATPTLSLPSPFNVGSPTALSVTSENITQPDGTIIPRMVASWTAAADAFVTGYEIAWSENGGPWDTTISTGTRWVIPASVTGRSYDVRIRSVNALNKQSAWVTVTGTVSAAPTVAPAAPALTATGGVFTVRLTWTFGDSRTDIRGVEVWYAATNDRSTASRLSLEAYPRQEYTHVGLSAGGGGYYWARTVDTFGNVSAWYPLSATGGDYAVASSDPSALLTQLNNSLGISQLSATLAAPITTLTSAPVLAAIGNMPFESAANASNATNAANASLQATLADFDLQKRMTWQESATNSTMTLDPITGKWALLATANVTTDVSAQLTAVQVLANATAATLTSTVSTLTTVSGNLTSTQAAVTILQGQITTTASTVYVDNSVANATGPITTTAANAYTALAASELQSAIDAFTGQQSAQALTASVALANTNIATAANAISAQASSFAALVSTVAGGLAAITTEQTTRATADTALAQTTTTLTATVASNLAATTTALATKATIAYVDAATATLTASIASTSSTLTTAYQAADTAALAAAATASTSYVQTYAYSKSAVDAAIASSQTTLTTNFTTGDTTTLTNANAHSDTAAATAYTNAQSYVQGYSYSKSTVDTAIATAQTTLTTNFTAGDATTLTSAQTYVQSYTYSKSTIDTSIATSQSTLTATFNTSNAGNTAASTSLAASDLQNSIDAFVTGQATQLLTANVASAVSFATATATAVSALTTSFSALVASVSGNTALITTEQTARANADGALAQAITTLTASGPTGYAAVSTAALASVSAISGLQAQYVLKVDTNGHSAGMTLASGGTGSAVVFLADKFAFVAPDGTGTPKNVMTVGTIGGVSTFGFNGNAIVDGTIVAQALAATNLSAIRADLGTVTAGRAQNAANTNFIDFNATGTNPFLQVGSNIALNADGSGVFARSLVSAPLLVASGTCGDTTLATAGLSISSGTFYIHTGFNVGSGAWNNVANIYRAGIGANTIYASGGTWHNNHDVWILDARILITPGYVADGRAAPTWNPGNFVSANGSSWASGGLTVTEGDLIIEVTIAGVAQNDAGWSGPVMAALNWSVYRA